jgi:hypothetical protein
MIVEENEETEEKDVRKRVAGEKNDKESLG